MSIFPFQMGLTSCTASKDAIGRDKSLASAPGVRAGKLLKDFTPVETNLSRGNIPLSAQRFSQQNETFFAFDTVINVSAFCSEETIVALKNQCAYFESIFSRTVEGSDIWNINIADKGDISVEPETAEIIERSLEYANLTQGRCDITIGAVTTLWDFKNQVVPDDKDIKAALNHIDYTKISVSGNIVSKTDAQTKLDLGAVAKGYIADYLCAMLIEAHCDCGFVNLGGNVKTIGLRPDGTEWNIGIQDPNVKGDSLIASVPGQDISVVTSGVYERQFTLGDKIYWHILDPKTGYPVESEIKSATIVSKKSIDADPIATSLFLMRVEDALEWIKQQKGLECLLVDKDDKIHMTSSIFTLA
ncbi:MAG: FAD:protein FMN transferase [Eggerthellaceae bacterium]|nr:FAD:protein FMN transferase [Eggerthellaceae bacterium]